MNVLKKITGVILIVWGVILSMGILITIKNSIVDATKVIEEEGKSAGISYSIGCLIAIIIFIFLARYLFKRGIKLLKGDQIIVVDSIEEIGKSE